MRAYLEPVFKRIELGSFEGFAEKIEASLKSGKKEFVITANPEILMKAENDERLLNMLLGDETRITPDGISVVKALRQNGFEAAERITGMDLAERLLPFCGEAGMSVYLLGAKENVVSDLAAQLQEKHPSMTVNFHNGYDGDKDKIFEEIRKLEPDLVLVALGVPAQELLIAKHIEGFSKGVFMGVGGSFDVLSGHIKRAPKLFIRTGTEWLYRIVTEPSRLKRFYESNVKFMKYIK